jgi:hypothetical protein
MQEKPPISPPVSIDEYPVDNLFQPPKKRGIGWLNIITAVFLGFFILFTAIDVLSTSYYTSLSTASENVSNAFKTGILYVDGEGAVLFAFIIFFPLGVWGFVAFMLSLADYRRNKSRVKKLPVVWAGILFGVIILVIAGSFYLALGLSCIDEYHCALPIRPGVMVPTPGP